MNIRDLIFLVFLTGLFIFRAPTVRVDWDVPMTVDRMNSLIEQIDGSVVRKSGGYWNLKIVGVSVLVIADAYSRGHRQRLISWSGGLSPLDTSKLRLITRCPLRRGTWCPLERVSASLGFIDWESIPERRGTNGQSGPFFTVFPFHRVWWNLVVVTVMLFANVNWSKSCSKREICCGTN